MNYQKNPDSSFCKGMKKRLKANNGYCPNSDTKTADDKCPCKDFRENKKPYEFCFCGLYQKLPDEGQND